MIKWLYILDCTGGQVDMICRGLKKFKNVICFLLVVFFAINISGCGSDNGVTKNKVNSKIGIGANTIGYTVYSQSTFDKMSEELLMGYLLNGREFTLLVLPGKGDGSDENPYTLLDEDNILYTSTLAGIYKYDEKSASFVNPEKKLLVYYVTDVELRSWFANFAEDDNFMSNVMDFADTEYDLEKPSRFKCEQLVNMGTGMNAKSFCGQYSNSSYSGGIINNSEGDFSNANTGGMFLLFGYGSIEGYITYNHILGYKGSEVANTLTNPSDYYNKNMLYNVSNIQKFNYRNMIFNSDGSYTQIGKALMNDEYDYTSSEINSFLNGATNDDLKRDLLYLYTEVSLNAASPGYQKLKTTYELLGSALLSDNNVSSLSALKTMASNATTDTDKWSAIKDMVDMIDDTTSFNQAAQKEAFSIKLSVGLYSRYMRVIDNPSIDNMFTGYYHNSRIGAGIADEGHSVGYDKALSLTNGVDDGGPTDNSYLLLITADGFTIDRGTQEEQKTLGYSDMLDWGTVLSELVRMDGCPNGTAAAKMYNMIANLKIYAGLALTVAGVSAVAIAAVGLAVASVIAKLALVSSVTPVPGARIVALVLVAIAGLVAIGAGLYTFFSGLDDKARLAGLGASETNYCNTYISTFNLLFETLSLSIPVYHYEIPEDTSPNADLSLTFCLAKNSKYDDTTGTCTGGDEPKLIPLYYYADLGKAEALSLEGCPMLMYFQDGKMVDYIYGATTPSFIVEMLRVWGLLSMRELVYNAQISADNKMINVYHTNNNNSRTHTIMEANHCFTLDYAKDLSGKMAIGKNDFCYGEDGSWGVTTSIINKEYINQSSNERSKSLLTVSMPTSSSGLNNTINNLSVYDLYYSATSAYKFNEYKNEKITGLIDESIKYEPASLDLSKIYLKVDRNDESGGTDYVDINGTVYASKDDAPKYSIKRVGNYFLIDGLILRADNVLDALGGTLSKVATFNGTVDELEKGFVDLGLSNEQGESYTFANFLDYLTGGLVFETKETKLSIYYTVTVMEAPQAASNGDKTCDDGEYLYYRDNKYWWDNDSKCLSDDNVKSKDSAYATTDFNSNDVRYYSTSVYVGYILLKLNEQGEFVKSVNWIAG